MKLTLTNKELDKLTKFPRQKTEVDTKFGIANLDQLTRDWYEHRKPKWVWDTEGWYADAHE